MSSSFGSATGIKGLFDLIAVDSKRVLAHTLPGFIVFIGLLMVYDSLIADPNQRFTTTVFLSVTPSDSLTVTLSLAFFGGLLLGLMLDSIGHRFFEELICKEWLAKDARVEEGKRYKSLVANVPELKTAFSDKGDNYEYQADDLYPFIDDAKVDESQAEGKEAKKVSIPDYLMNQFYSYFEFYQNAGIALGLISFAFPLYLTHVLGFPTIISAAAFFVGIGASGLLLFSAAHTLSDHRETRASMIDSTIRKKYKLKDIKTLERTVDAATKAAAAAKNATEAATNVVTASAKEMEANNIYWTANMALAKARSGIEFDEINTALNKIGNKVTDAQTVGATHKHSHVAARKEIAELTEMAGIKANEVTDAAKEVFRLKTEMTSVYQSSLSHPAKAAVQISKKAAIAKDAAKAVQDAADAANKISTNDQEALQLKGKATEAAQVAKELEGKIEKASKAAEDILIAITRETVANEMRSSAEKAATAATHAATVAAKAAEKASELIK